MRRRHLVLAAASASAGGMLASAAASPLGALNALASLGSCRVAQDQPYGAHARQRFDLFGPRPTPAAAPPLVVFFYGGAWNHGRRQDYRFVGEALAGRGLMTLVADYRLHPEVRYPDFLRDCAQATAHALGHAAAWGADPARVVLAGHSAGAYNAAMLALDARWLTQAGVSRHTLAGWVGLAGPYDFLPIRTPEVQAAFGHPVVPRDSQPSAHAAQSMLPCLLGSASSDARVDPQHNTAALARALRAAGSQVQERYWPRVDHETVVAALAWPLRTLAPVLDDLAGFVHQLPPAAASAVRLDA